MKVTLPAQLARVQSSGCCSRKFNLEIAVYIYKVALATNSATSRLWLEIERAFRLFHGRGAAGLSAFQKMSIMQRLIHNMGFYPADLPVLPDQISIHPGAGNIAYKQHPDEPFTIRAEYHLSIG